MISPKKIIKMARKWQNQAAFGRKRITFLRTSGAADGKSCKSSTVNKGHFVVYTADRSRFVIPLVYLNNIVIRELLKMAEEEFGLPSDGPITLPCDAEFMECVVSLIQRQGAKDMEKALIMSIINGHCSSSSYLQQGQTNQQVLICGF